MARHVVVHVKDTRHPGGSIVSNRHGMEDMGQDEAYRRMARYPGMTHSLCGINTETRLLGAAAKIEPSDISVACCAEKYKTYMTNRYLIFINSCNFVLEIKIDILIYFVNWKLTLYFLIFVERHVTLLPLITNRIIHTGTHTNIRWLLGNALLGDSFCNPKMVC